MTFSVDCARTHEFNFDGIVTEAFEALGVGQGEDDNMMMMIFINLAKSPFSSGSQSRDSQVERHAEFCARRPNELKCPAC